jgi:hypothetical protein
MSAGNEIEVDALPLLQLTVFGNPEIVGDTENSQLVALSTAAVSLTLPPVAANEVGEAVNDTTVVVVDELESDAAPLMPGNPSDTTATIASPTEPRLHRASRIFATSPLKSRLRVRFVL